MLKRAARAAALGLLALPLAACADDGGAADGRLAVVTSFYPLQYVTERVAGDRAQVSDLTRPGSEPHDLELAPRDVAAITDADLVVYLGGGFQPSVEDALASDAAPDTTLDVAGPARLDRTLAAGGEHTEPGRDPHFWLDPTRLAAVSKAVADRLAQADPDGAATYAANQQALAADLTALDRELAAGLADCANPDLVTSHTAFGYLAARYGLTQVGILGLTPDQEPDPGSLARAADFVHDHQVRTIYYETLVSPDVARTVAGETGAQTAVLDPIESLTTTSAGSDYLAIMRSNLSALQKGQPCP
jgi:zinc transport system substrate-binding protein